MSETKWTKGNWEYFLPENGWMDIVSRSEVVAKVSCQKTLDDDGLMPNEESECNARIIATAPELYEALSVVENSISSADHEWRGSSMHKMMLAALAKARGEQP